MKPPHSLLNIEIFEDRLLPSAFAIGGFDPIATSPTHSFHVSVWHQENAAGSDFGSEGNFVPHSSNNPNASNDLEGQATGNAETSFSNYSINLNQNSAGDLEGQATGNAETSIPTNLNQNSVGGFHESALRSVWDRLSGGESSGTTPNTPSFPFEASANNFAWGGANFPHSLDGVTFPPPSTGSGLDGGGFNRFSDPRSVTGELDGREPPWFGHDYQTFGMNPPGGLNGTDPPSDSTGDPGSSQDNTVAPSEVTTPASASPSNDAAPSAPELFLALISPQPTSGQPLISEQLAQTEPHILAEITLAAISLMESQTSPAIPAMPVIVGAYPGSATELYLPSTVVDRTTLKVNAPTPLPAAEAIETTPETPSPIEIHAPTGVPVAGVIGLDAAELDERVSRVLASIANLPVGLTEELEQPETYAWFVAAGLLSFWAGYIAWINQKSQRVVGFPFGRGLIGTWEGKEHDVRNR